jgi:lipid A disaccharide synthetase
VPGRIEWCLLWAWRWGRVPFIAMPNIILQRQAVPELIGLACQPEKIAQELIRLLKDVSARDKMLRDYALIRQALGAELLTAPTERTAQIVEEMLSEATGRPQPERVAV